ncbi:MAG: hypothetical protein BWX69_01246 [Planctomycetes bacterium ADurb.Bin069]|nr:MAG: hypothetical protein BWX69_01246 [Planctomycetes bacterium ADurb.Bin069]
MDENQRQRYRGRGRMRPIGGRAGRTEGGPQQQQRPRDDRPRQDPRRPQSQSAQGRREHRVDPMAQRRGRDDRVFGALCHGGYFLGWWGIATTAAIWALRKDWSRSIRLTGVQAIAYQTLAQILFLVLALVACRAEAVTSLAPLLDQGGLFALLANEAAFPLGSAKIALGGVAALYALLCLVGLEPSYPIVGFCSRLVLGIKRPPRPEEPPAKSEKPEEQKSEESPAGSVPAARLEQKSAWRYSPPISDHSRAFPAAPRTDERSNQRPPPKPESVSEHPPPSPPQ